MQDLFGQHNSSFNIVDCPFPERHNTGISILDIFFLTYIGDILAIAKTDTLILAPGIVKLDSIAVKLILSAVSIKDAALSASEQRSDRRWDCYLECRRCAFIGPKCKRTCFSSMLRESQKGSGYGRCFKRFYRNMGQLIAYMLCLDLADPAHRFTNIIDPEGLRAFAVRRDGIDQSGQCQIFEMNPFKRIAHIKLISAVSFFRDRAFGSIRQPSKPVSGEIRLSCFVKYRLHMVHHLGFIVTVRPLVFVMLLTPGTRVGKSSDVKVTYWL